jgi:hypothetical protein
MARILSERNNKGYNSRGINLKHKKRFETLHFRRLSNRNRLLRLRNERVIQA